MVGQLTRIVARDGSSIGKPVDVNDPRFSPIRSERARYARYCTDGTENQPPPRPSLMDRREKPRETG